MLSDGIPASEMRNHTEQSQQQSETLKAARIRAVYQRRCSISKVAEDLTATRARAPAPASPWRSFLDCPRFAGPALCHRGMRGMRGMCDDGGTRHAVARLYWT